MENLIQPKIFKISDNDLEFDIEFDYNFSDYSEEINEIDNRLEENESILNELENNILNITNDCDNIDYVISVCSGILAGILDSLWIGEFDLNRGTEWSSEKINSFVENVAKKKGYKGKNGLQGAIKFLEDQFGLASDSNTNDFGGGRQHHLRDFSHHPTILGLIFSMLTQFTEKSYGTDTSGMFLCVDVKNKTFIGKGIGQKFLFGTVNWFFHLVSDIAGSSNNPGRGTGLPGPLLSFAKKTATLPIFKNSETGENKFSIYISKLFNGTLLAEKDSNGKIIKETVKPFDFRSELGVFYELGRQSIPVILNECIVRGFYFIRQLTREIKLKKIKKIKDIEHIEWRKTLPFKNRTIMRMLTISCSTFTAFDLVDATIRSAIQSKGNKAVFLNKILLKINFIGVGRLVIAIGTDLNMEYKRENLRNECIKLMSEQLHLINAKVYYNQAGTWKTAKSTIEAITETKHLLQKSITYSITNAQANKNSLKNIGNSINKIEKKNEKLISDLKDILKWE